MLSYSEYHDQKSEEIEKELFETIEALDLPDNIEMKLISIIEDNLSDIAEDRYQSELSDYHERCYEEHKERDI